MNKVLLILIFLIVSCEKQQSFTVEEVIVKNEADNISLAGNLTLPSGEGPFTGVVLVAGSGEMDRDETFHGHKFFKVLAEYLAKNGIASYRYDKRGVGASTGNFETATIRNFSSDALEALKFLKSHPRIAQAGFIGHSEGTKAASMATLNNNYCDFLVLMAPYALPSDQGFLRLTEAVLSARGIPREDIDKHINIESQIWELLKQDSSLKVIRVNAEHIIRTNLDDYHYLKNTKKEDLDNAISNDVKYFVNALNLDEIRNYNEATFLSELKCPVFALTGNKDLFVVYPDDFNRVKELIESNPNIESTFKVYPNLNHLFQTCETGLVEEVSHIAETMNKQVLYDIAGWIKKLK